MKRLVLRVLVESGSLASELVPPSGICRLVDKMGCLQLQFVFKRYYCFNSSSNVPNVEHEVCIKDIQ